MNPRPRRTPSRAATLARVLAAGLLVGPALAHATSDSIHVRFAQPFCCADVFDNAILPKARVDFVIRQALEQALRKGLAPGANPSKPGRGIDLAIRATRVAISAPAVSGGFASGGIYRARVEIVAELSASGQPASPSITVAAESERAYLGGLGNWRTSLATRVLRFAAREVGNDLVERLHMTGRLPQ